MMQIYDEKVKLSSPKLLPDSPKIQLPSTELLDTLGRGDTKVSEKQANFQSRARKKAIRWAKNNVKILPPKVLFDL